MKKALIGTLALGLVIGAGALGSKSFANEQEFANPTISNIEQNNLVQDQAQFKVLNQETNQFETLDNSEYGGPNSNNNYRNCCQYNSYGNIN